ncbi:MAG TPA: lipid II flippase MurJ [Pseudonocardiaceae bacterium]|nr:lipid II flippase MurJ [Pseudonocardiaceae bacterium]
MAALPVTAFEYEAPTTTARNSATVAGWTLVSRATGLLRVVVIGAVLGPTYFANAFQAGYVVPNLVFTLIAGPVLAMVLVPGVVRAVGVGGLSRAREVFGRVTGWMLAVSAAVVALLMILSPAVAWTLTFGIPDPAQRARALWLTTLLVLLVAPQVLLYTLLHLGMAAQQARGRFALAAGAPAVENVILILTVVLAGWYYGTGLDVDNVPAELVIVLGVGSTAAVAVHAALQLFGTARVGLLTRPSMGWRYDPEARAVTRRLMRSVGVAAWPAAAMYVLFALAGTVPGGVFVVQLSYAVFYSLSYVSARAVSMAALPGLAHAAHREDGVIFGSAWRQGLSYAIIASLPLLVLLAVLSGPTANILANGELRNAALIGVLATCLGVVAVAQMVGGVHDIGRQALFARLDDRIPRRASEVAFVVMLVVAVATLLLPAEGSRLVWLVGAILAGELAAAGMVLVALRRAIQPERFIEFRPLAGALMATVAMLPVAAAAWWLQHVTSIGRLGDLVLLTLGGALALGVYVLGVYVLVLRVAVPRRIGGGS